MSQFTVYRNENPGSKADFPFLVDVQSDLLSELRTRVVIPLCSRNWLDSEPITKLVPELEIDGEKYLALTPQLAGISVKDLGESVANLAQRRSDFIAALDLLVTGF